MNINLTLIGQSIAFIVFVAFVAKYVWPPLIKALNDRKNTIADGLAAAERGKHEQELAAKRATEAIHEARERAAEIIAKAEQRANEIIEDAKNAARSEGDRLKAAANAEIEQEVFRAKEHLRGQVVSLAVAGAGQVLRKEIDAKAHESMLKDLVAQI